MGDSNGSWGELARHDDELAEAFDQYERLPERGTNPALDAFIDRKHLSIESLVKLGARINPPNVLVLAFPGGIKFRDIVTDARWSYAGSSWNELKIVPAGIDRARIAIVAEGETDAARLTMLYPDVDVAVLPAGADPRPHTQAYAGQLNEYELVLLAQDPDDAGNAGAAMLSEHLTTKTQRFTNPSGDDWASLEIEPPALPDPDTIDVPLEQRLLVNARDLLTIEPPDIESYLEQAVLPVGGQLILHGAKKSFKSFLALDLGSALAQSQPWAGFEPTDEPISVAVMQFEIPWQYYRQRVAMLREAATHRDLFDENFLTWTPMTRPRFRAGHRPSEDVVLRALDDRGVNVFILDPIRRATGAVDLNAEKDVRPMLDFFERIQNLGITVITTHHDNKTGERSRGGDPNEMTGSGAFGGDADSIVSVALPRGNDIRSAERNLHFLLRNGPSPSARSMQLSEDGTISYGMHAIDEEEPQLTPGSEAPEI